MHTSRPNLSSKTAEKKPDIIQKIVINDTSMVTSYEKK